MNKKQNVFYWVNHLSKNGNLNSGIQRVTRMLAKYCPKKINLIPVKWVDNKLVELNHKELNNIKQFNGPDIKKYHKISLLRLENSKLLIPELLTEFNLNDWKNFELFMKKKNIELYVILYDLIPLKIKIFYSNIITKNHSIYCKKILKFKKIFPISEYVANDLKKYFYFRYFFGFLKNIKTIQISGEVHKKKLKLNKKILNPNFFNILCVSSIEKRKNIKILADAIKNLNRKKYNIKLILIGAMLDKNYYESLFNKHIEYLKVTSHSTLQNIYHEAHLVAYPSTEEGFGMPVVEALWHKKNIICHNASVFEEIYNTYDKKITMIDMRNSREINKKILFFYKNNIKEKKNINEIDLKKFKTWKQYSCEIFNEIIN